MSDKGLRGRGIVLGMDKMLDRGIRVLPYLWVWGLLLIYPLNYIDPMLAKIDMGIVMLSVGSIIILSMLGIDTTDE